MKVTLSIRTKICPPLTINRARLVARMILPMEKKVLVSGGNKTFFVLKNEYPIRLKPPARDRGLMRVRLAVYKSIGARETLTEFRVERLVEELDTDETVRVEGGKYTYLSILEGKRSVYRLGKCRMCRRDTLGSNEYCRKCLPRRIGGDEMYYSFNSCAQLLIRLARSWAISTGGGGGDREKKLERSVELVQVQWNEGRRI